MYVRSTYFVHIASFIYPCLEGIAQNLELGTQLLELGTQKLELVSQILELVSQILERDYKI